MKKFLCLMSVIVLVLALNSVALAAVNLKDIKGTKYEDAVNHLVDVGLVNGFDDGTYRPLDAVTRAQMAKLMVIALGQEGRVANASKAATSFTDMKSDHWAYGFVNAAKDIGIINGYTDGSFHPNTTVSYAEAVTMAVRALEYEKKVEQSSEAWPNNYLTVARELNILKNISTFSNNAGAGRGDVGILLWNMLNTGVCAVKGSNANGLIYGQGDIMLTKNLGYIYMNDGMITDVDFDKNFENATVTVTGSSSVKLSMSDTDVFKYFGKTLTMMYNSKTKKILTISAVKNYKEDSGAIEKITTKKITINDTEYALPDKSNIILYKTDSIDDAVDATAYLDGKTLKYIIAKGAQDVQVGLVTAKDVTVSKKDGISLKKAGASKSTDYALIDEDDMPNRYDVVIYYLNSDNCLGIIKTIDVDDAYDIDTLTSSKIKLGKTTYTYNSDDFVVVSVTTSTIKTLSFKSIDETDDVVYPYVYSGKTYLIVFTDAADSSDNKTETYNELTKYISNVKSKVSDEANYTQATFVPFLEAYNAAVATKSSATISKITEALDDLKTANSNLKKASTTTEKDVSAKRAELRKLVDGNAATAVKNKTKYTAETYKTFESALSDANKILARKNTTLTEVTNAYNKLNEAYNGLALIQNSEEYKTALSLLESAIERANTLDPKEYDYTESTYSAYSTAYSAATTAKKNAASKTADELKAAAEKLTDAIEKLEPALDSLKDDLNDVIVKCAKILNAGNTEYTEESFDNLRKAYNDALEVAEGNDIDQIKKAKADLEKAKADLQKVDDLLNLAVKAVIPMRDAPGVSEALNMPAEKLQDKIQKIENIESAAKQDLRDLISEAEEKEDDTGKIDKAKGHAKEVLHGSFSLEDIANAYAALKEALGD